MFYEKRGTSNQTEAGHDGYNLDKETRQDGYSLLDKQSRRDRAHLPATVLTCSRELSFERNQSIYANTPSTRVF
jgi:hypothetical protein